MSQVTLGHIRTFSVLRYRPSYVLTRRDLPITYYVIDNGIALFSGESGIVSGYTTTRTWLLFMGSAYLADHGETF
jgi:hypothetical protein